MLFNNVVGILKTTVPIFFRGLPVKSHQWGPRLKLEGRKKEETCSFPFAALSASVTPPTAFTHSQPPSLTTVVLQKIFLRPIKRTRACGEMTRSQRCGPKLHGVQPLILWGAKSSQAEFRANLCKVPSVSSCAISYSCRTPLLRGLRP